MLSTRALTGWSMNRFTAGRAERTAIADHDLGALDRDGAMLAELPQAAGDRFDSEARVVGHVGLLMGAEPAGEVWVAVGGACRRRQGGKVAAAWG